MVGTANNVGGALPAAATAGSGNSALTYTATTSGAAGNSIRVRLIGGKPNTTLSVTVVDRLVSITLSTDNDGAPTNKASEIITGITAHNEANALLTVSLASGSDGTGTVRDTAVFSLAGGRDEPYPINTPVIINTSAAAAALGNIGTLPAAVGDVWRTSGLNAATVIVVRVDAGEDDATTLANVIGDKVTRTGIYSLLDASSETGKTPAIIAATGHTDNLAAAFALQSTAEDLGGVAIVDVSGATFNDAIGYGSRLGSCYAVWPSINVYDANAGEVVARPPSALVAGHIARVDGDEGWHNSPSNRPISDVLSATTPVDFEINNPNSTANILNQEYITTVVRRDGGVYLWGNRLVNGTLITHRRVERIIGKALGEYVADWIDRNVDIPFIDFVLTRFNNFLRDQTVRGNLTGGEATFDPAQNTADSLAANRVTFSVALGIANVAEHIIIQQRVTDIYNEQIIAEASRRSAA
ncbi:phage tail sheath subtilisin-like domain-containing protein [Candidatus Persebacteraceae bacterium Df01]|uniref:Phage tail sheath subtilisin-like domain-containing protein n=1 Tax=Candidatus Doriopsillibacter californiensis TaxID=2970740 RepID=A0ABT7QLR9_9GAMM|nr:phage tail sheath subtilisin-like domain-containing protein [Candidatus Persebacteraceae bacterium Df01]